jgi:SWI/SNF-related matrix-associated actin-dependent regulator 1 of chromatin subfamily A
MGGYSLVPSNYEFLKKLRASKTATLKPCSFLKESTQLRYYQVVGATNLMCLSRMILGDSVGLGKTCELIAAYAFLLQKDPTLKLLVVTPNSAMDQWAEEFEKFSKDIKVHVMSNEFGKLKGQNKCAHVAYLKKRGIPYNKITGFDARKMQYDYVKAHVLITSYFTVQEDYTFLIQNRSPNYMVAWDECQAFKSRTTKTHFGASKISEKAVRVYGLSATVIKNRLEEAYNIFRIIVPGLFGSVARFHRNFVKLKKMKKKPGSKKRFYTIITGYKNLKDFRTTIEPYFLIRKTKDVAKELPAIISKKVVLEMTEPQAVLYKLALNGYIYQQRVKTKYFEFRDYYDKLLTPSEKDVTDLEKLSKAYSESLTEDGMLKNKLAALSFCQLVSNGPQWLDKTEPGESSKETEFKRIFDQELRAEKTIVFTRFKSGIPRLATILDELEIKYTMITGDVIKEDRKSARLDFQNLTNKIPVIFITSAGSAALNLQAANVILFYDTPWSYGDLYQTIGRAQRIGSIHPHVHIIHMVNKKTIDEHVLDILESKKQLITEVVGDIAEGAIEFTGKDSIIFKEDESSIDALFKSVFKKAA